MILNIDIILHIIMLNRFIVQGQHILLIIVLHMGKMSWNIKQLILLEIANMEMEIMEIIFIILIKLLTSQKKAIQILNYHQN